MAETKRILCLANSRKLSGRCVAGVEIADDGFGDWVRPVSARATHEVSETEREYHDGSDPALLDIIDVPLIAHSPYAFQTENWLLDPALYWDRQGAAGWATWSPCWATCVLCGSTGPAVPTGRTTVCPRRKPSP